MLMLMIRTHPRTPVGSVLGSPLSTIVLLLTALMLLGACTQTVDGGGSSSVSGVDDPPDTDPGDDDPDEPDDPVDTDALLAAIS